MRKSFDGLSGWGRSALGRESTDGRYFLFANCRRDRGKILYWDRDGLALWYKRLEAGTFEMLDAAGPLALRLRESAVVRLRTGEYLDSDAPKNVSAKEPFGKAVNYLRNHGEALQVYATNPAVPTDNNETEPLMKQVAVGRMNWLFIGSISAGRRAANRITLVSSVLRHDLGMWIYIKSVLDAPLSGSVACARLRPDVWAKSHPEYIRRYRQEERSDRADRKQVQHSARRAAQTSARQTPSRRTSCRQAAHHVGVPG